jgi:hypothetical protein
MSERVALGAGDGDSRWIGVRRHQAVLVIAGVGLSGDWVIGGRRSILELGAGCALMLGALIVYDGLSVAQLVVVSSRYAGRTRWTLVSATPQSPSMRLDARGEVVVQGFELRHRGRLDLNGLDDQGAAALAVAVDALAAGESTAHVSVHVASTPRGARTLLTLDGDCVAPPGWSDGDGLLLEVAGIASQNSTAWLLERWRYLRSSGHVVRVVRITDFSSAPEGRAVLERLGQSDHDVTVALHFDVVAGSKARRIVERAVHRLGSDGALTRSAGFRRTSRAERALERVGQRESLVANGRALLRLAVYVCVRAGSPDQLDGAVRDLIRSAHDAGLRCEQGLGRQAIWYCHQLPGGPGW